MHTKKEKKIIDKINNPECNNKKFFFIYFVFMIIAYIIILIIKSNKGQ
jgi:hypothetical protein